MKALGVVSAVGALAFGMTAPMASHAAVLEVILNQTIEAEESTSFDLNGDGVDDFEVLILTPNFNGDSSAGVFERAIITALDPAPRPESDIPLPVDPDVPLLDVVGIPIDDDDEGRDAGNNIFVENEETGFAQVFQAGDVVGGPSDDSLRLFQAILYTTENDPEGEGPFAEIGATGFIGLEMISFDEIVTFGWLEVSRGSITLHRAGAETTAGVGALVPASVVPVPPAIGFMVVSVAAFGLVARRRRKARA